MNKLWFFILMNLGISFSLVAQTTYTISNIPYNPDPFTAGTSLTLTDDEFSTPVSIGFPFEFYGQPYDSVVIGSNGIVTFNLLNAGNYCPWLIGIPPLPSEILNSILCPWQDINPYAGGQINTVINGTAPFRRFVVSYYQIPMFSCVGLLFSQQVILYESTNIIETHILNRPYCSWNSSNATHGLMDSLGTNPFIVPGRNASPWTAQLDSWRFDPGNNQFNTNVVSGKVFQDLNGNCVPDSNELGIPNRPVLANGGDFYTYTDGLGNYSLHVDTGTYVITEIPPLFYTVSCPAGGSYSLNFPAQFDTISGNNFSDSILFYCSDLIVDIGTTNLSSCLTEWVGVSYCNQGTVTDSNVVINLLLHDSLIVTVPNSNMVLVGPQHYQYNAGLLGPGQCGNFNFQISVGCDTVGTIYCMNASITGSIGNDCDTVNNTSADCHALIGSWDPNDLYVLHQNGGVFGFVTEDYIDDNDELTYRVRFQNAGNDTAFTVQIKCTLPAELNAMSVVPGASSHNYNWMVLNGELIIDFFNILLPDSATNPAASEGFVKFRIQQQPGNLPGTDIVNQARIYFDLNPPVLTNQTHNIIPIGAGILEKQKQGTLLYPNPGKNFITLEFASGLKQHSVEVIDFTGRVLKSLVLGEGKQQLDCSFLATGSYFIRILNPETGVETLRFQKQ